MYREKKAAGLRTRAASNGCYDANHTSPLDVVITRLHEVRKSGGGWQALCPAHEDQHPSLSIKQGDGKVLLYCHAGCEFESIVAALGLEAYQLFDDAKAPRQVAPGVSRADVRKGLHHELIVLSLIVGDQIEGKVQNDVDKEREPVAVRRIRTGLEALYGRE